MGRPLRGIPGDNSVLQDRDILGEQAADAYGDVAAPEQDDWSGATAGAQEYYLDATAAGRLLLYQTEAAANYAYAEAEINANHTRALAAIEIEASFLEDTAGSYSQAIDDFADYDGSPWSGYDRDIAAAEKDRVDDEQAAARVWRTAEADADQAAELQKAVARQVFDDDRAGAGGVKIDDLSEAAVDRLFAESGAVVTLAGTGFYLGINDLPGGLGVEPLTAVQQDDYWQAAGYDEYYLGAVGAAFSPWYGPMALTYQSGGLEALFLADGYGDLTEELDLPADPNAGDPPAPTVPGALSGKRALPKPKGDVSPDVVLTAINGSGESSEEGESLLSQLLPNYALQIIMSGLTQRSSMVEKVATRLAAILAAYAPPGAEAQSNSSSRRRLTDDEQRLLAEVITAIYLQPGKTKDPDGRRKDIYEALKATHLVNGATGGVAGATFIVNKSVAAITLDGLVHFRKDVYFEAIDPKDCVGPLLSDTGRTGFYATSAGARSGLSAWVSN